MASLQEAFSNMLSKESYTNYVSPLQQEIQQQQRQQVAKLTPQEAAARIVRQHFFPINHLVYQKYIDGYYWFENKYNGMQYCHPDRD